MGDVLVIRKSDKTIHIVPVDQEAFYRSQNNRLAANDKMGLEVMDEEKALALGFFDKSYKGASEANANLREKDDKIAELEAKLKALQGDSDRTGLISDKEKRAELIAEHNKAIEDLNKAVEEKAHHMTIKALQAKVDETAKAAEV